MGLTLASYSNNLLNLIIRPAGRSRSFKWLGRGDIHNIPYIPRPIFIPRWIPKERPEYVAKWVPTTPGPRSNIHSPQQSGFGPPKTNSVVPQTYDVAPAAVYAPPPAPAPAPAPAPPPVPAAPASTYAPVPLQAPSKQPNGYAQPHADDIISVNNNYPVTIGTLPLALDPINTEQPLFQQNVIPATAIRNTFTGVAEVPGEPSFSPLIQDEQVTNLNDFRTVDPGSIIIIDNGNVNSLGFIDSGVPDIVPTTGTRGNFNSIEPNTISSQADPDTFFLTEITDATPTELTLNDGTSIEQGNDIVFIVDPDSTLSPLTTTFLNENESFQSSQDNAGKSFLGPTIISQPIEQPIQSNLISQPNFETLFNEDVKIQNLQSNVVTKLNEGVVSDDTFLITQDSQLGERPQFSQDFKPSQEFLLNDNSQFSQELSSNQGFQPNDNFQFSQELQPNQGFQSNGNSQLFVDGVQPNEFFISNETPQLIQEQQPNQGFQSNDNSQFSQELQPNQEFQSNDNSQLFTDGVQSNDFASNETPQLIQEQQPNQGFQSNDNSQLFTDGVQSNDFFLSNETPQLIQVQQPNQGFQTNDNSQLFNDGVQSNDFFVSNETPQLIQEQQSNQGFQSNDNSQLFTDEVQSNDFASNETPQLIQEQQPNQGFQSNDNSQLFTDGVQSNDFFLSNETPQLIQVQQPNQGFQTNDNSQLFNDGVQSNDFFVSNETPQLIQEQQSNQGFQSNDNSQLFTDEVQSNDFFISNETPQLIQEQQPNQGFQTTDNSQLFTDGVQSNDFFVSNATPQLIQKQQPNQGFQSNDNSQLFTEGVQPNEFFISNKTPQFIQELQPSQEFPSNDFASQSNQGGQQFQQSDQPNDNSDIFIVTGEGTQNNGEFQSDQVAQFSNFQLGQKINFRPLPIQEHNSNTGTLVPSLPRPALVAPPVSPILASSRSISESRSDTVGQAVPSGRSISTDFAIPQPVPIPIGPLASLTLDFPQVSDGERQARVASNKLPFGARLYPRPARRFRFQPHVLG